MSLKINTNIAALNAHRNMLRTDSGLTKSLERLSSGLRINKAADDASGMAIADSLKAQALGLKQAVANANDGISVVQVADGALEEAVNIVNTIKTKAIQAASDGQSTDSRGAIQRDINKLLEEMQMIATTTSFNGLNLLDGSFSGKKFHVGAYSGETLSVSISSVTTNNVGAFASQEGAAVTAVAFGASDFTINGTATNVSSADSATGANTTAHTAGSAWAKAAAINSIESDTGVTASATTTLTGSSVAAGTLSAGDITINGIDIGGLSVSANDANGALVNAINAVSNRSYVTAENVGGAIILTASDGSDITIDSLNDGEDTVGFGADSTAGAATSTQGGKITLESSNAITVGGTVALGGFTGLGNIAVGHTINSVDVSTNTLAELAITQADYALKDIDQVRSQLGSVQNQIESTVRNITITQVNVTAAESGIRDVDFAAESANFAKFQVLAQSGSFAMAQANASLQNVLRLLQ